MQKKWKIVIGILIIVLFLLTALTAVGYWHRNEIRKTSAAIQRINNRVLSLNDVLGKNLPPKPDQQLNDSTVAGIDMNNNGIRDDVELAIFEKYPNSARIRAGMLQYAQALQLELTEVFNSETLAKVMQKRGFSQSCIDEAVSRQTSYSNVDDGVKEVDNFVLNTDLRSRRQTEVFDKYMTTYSVGAGQQCDINLSILSN